jgi:hypothetical protein
MDKDMFVNELIKLAPSIAELKKHELPDDFINHFIESYKCYQKDSSKNIYTNDELLLLLQSYDCSKIEIGIVSFLNEIVETEDYFEIGNVEQDILSINKITLEVEVLDHEAADHVIWSCASNSRNFLQALLSAADFFSSKLKVYPIEPENTVILKRVQKCTYEAGGDKYIDFYKMLLGYFD